VSLGDKGRDARGTFGNLAILAFLLMQGADGALTAGQIAWATRGAAAARRVMTELAAPLEPGAAQAAADRLARELALVPLVASGLRASAGPALEGLVARPDGAIDGGRLWRLGGTAP